MRSQRQQQQQQQNILLCVRRKYCYPDNHRAFEDTLKMWHGMESWAIFASNQTQTTSLLLSISNSWNFALPKIIWNIFALCRKILCFASRQNSTENLYSMVNIYENLVWFWYQYRLFIAISTLFVRNLQRDSRFVWKSFPEMLCGKRKRGWIIFYDF